jgi:phosphonate transport system substrate-binding protein
MAKNVKTLAPLPMKQMALILRDRKMTNLLRNPILLLCFTLILGIVDSWAETLTIGRVADDPTKYKKILKPLLDYVVSQARDVGITEGSVKMTKNINETIHLLRAQKIDWVTASIAPALIYHDKTGADILLRTWRDGGPVYRTVFVARQDSSIESLDSLKGKTIAFQDPYSTSAYFIPLAILRAAGLRVIELASPKQKFSPDEVGYLFAGNELNISTWVQRGITKVGAYNDQNWVNPQHTPDVIKKDLKIFYQHKPVPRWVEIFRKDLDPRIKARIQEILVRADEDPEAQEALKSYSNTKKFDEFKGEALQGLDEVQRMMKFVVNEVK